MGFVVEHAHLYDHEKKSGSSHWFWRPTSFAVSEKNKDHPLLVGVACCS